MISESASTALGTVATVCWCIQLIPQIIFNWRKKDCTGLPPIMMLLWVVSGIPFGIYFCVSEPNIILQVQPHLFMFFCAISFAQSCYYPPKSMNRMKIAIIMITVTLVDIGMEVGFILWLRPLYRKGTTWPDLIFGVLASVLLAIGLLPPYFELAKRQGRVVGINFGFLLIDSLGAWLSIASVVVGNMDIMGIILYCIVAFMEIGIFASHFIWCCRFKWFGNGKNYIDAEDGDENDDNADHDDHAENHSNSVHKINSTTIITHETSGVGSTADLEVGSAIDMKQGNTTVTNIAHEFYREKDDEGDLSSIAEDYEMRDAYEYNENTSNIHAVHGIIMNNSKVSSSTGSIKI